MRADRLFALLLHLQARGRMTAEELAAELEVSVRTIYRDMDALSSAGVPVYTEAGPGGGCRLLEGYRTPLGGLSSEEATALLALGVPEPLRELGLGAAFSEGQRRVRAAAGRSTADATPLVHLDMPRWFHSREAVPCLPVVAHALVRAQCLSVMYPSGAQKRRRRRTVTPLGIVNKAGVWYVVVDADPRRGSVLRVARITDARVVEETFHRPADFSLVAFWDTWSADFEATRPRLAVLVHASPSAQRVFPEVFGDAVFPALAAARPVANRKGWRAVTLTFEHEYAAAARLAGFGDGIEVMSPSSVRAVLVANARAILRRHGA